MIFNLIGNLLSNLIFIFGVILSLTGLLMIEWAALGK